MSSVEVTNVKVGNIDPEKLNKAIEKEKERYNKKISEEEKRHSRRIAELIAKQESLYEPLRDILMKSFENGDVKSKLVTYSTDKVRTISKIIIRNFDNMADLADIIVDHKKQTKKRTKTDSFGENESESSAVYMMHFDKNDVEDILRSSKADTKSSSDNHNAEQEADKDLLKSSAKEKSKDGNLDQISGRNSPETDSKVADPDKKISKTSQKVTKNDEGAGRKSSKSDQEKISNGEEAEQKNLKSGTDAVTENERVGFKVGSETERAEQENLKNDSVEVSAEEKIGQKVADKSAEPTAQSSQNKQKVVENDGDVAANAVATADETDRKSNLVDDQIDNSWKQPDFGKYFPPL